jgi:hypothetical protein
MVTRMIYFLLVFDRAHRELIGEIEEFADADEAVRARFAKEASLAGLQGVEVVVLGAESREALENTHSRYFGTPRELAAS